MRDRLPQLVGDDARRGLLLDGREAAVLPCQEAAEGVSYLRVRSTAPAADAAGLLVEKVAAEVAPAPARGEKRP